MLLAAGKTCLLAVEITYSWRQGKPRHEGGKTQISSGERWNPPTTKVQAAGGKTLLQQQSLSGGKENSSTTVSFKRWEGEPLLQ